MVGFDKLRVRLVIYWIFLLGYVIVYVMFIRLISYSNFFDVVECIFLKC